MVIELGMEGAVGGGGGGEVGGEEGGGGVQEGGVGGGGGDEEVGLGEVPGGGEGGAAAVVGRAVAAVVVAPAQQVAGRGEDGREAGGEAGGGDGDAVHAAAEDVEPRGLATVDGALGAVGAQGGVEVGHDGVDLVVGTGGAGGEAEHAHVGCLDVDGHGAEVVDEAEHHRAALGAGTGHVGAYEAGKVAVDDFDQVARLQVDVGERVEGEGVAVGAGYDAESLHRAVVDGGVALGAGVADEQREAVVGAGAQLLDLGELAAHEHVVERERSALHHRLPLAAQADLVGRGKELKGSAF